MLYFCVLSLFYMSLVILLLIPTAKGKTCKNKSLFLIVNICLLSHLEVSHVHAQFFFNLVDLDIEEII